MSEARPLKKPNDLVRPVVEIGARIVPPIVPIEVVLLVAVLLKRIVLVRVGVEWL